MRINFNMHYNQNILNNIVDVILGLQKSNRFKVYRRLQISQRNTFKYCRVTNDRLASKIRFEFHLRSCILDKHSGVVVDRVDACYFNWETSIHSKITIKNAALIRKLIRLLSMNSGFISDTDLFSLIFSPLHTNMPVGYVSPAIVRDSSFVSNIYFDEHLVALLIDNTFTLTGFRFGVKIDQSNGGKQYLRYPGSISGLAKLPGTFSDYYQVNQLDLALMPQESLKFRLATSGYSKDNLIRKMINVRTVEYFLRRDILDYGVCDIKFEIYLTSYSSNQSKSSLEEDIDITAANSELFFVAMATRIISLLKYELAKQGKMQSNINMVNNYGGNFRTNFNKRFNIFKPNEKQSEKDSLSSINTISGGGLSVSFSKPQQPEPRQEIEVDKKAKPLSQIINSKFAQGWFAAKLLRLRKTSEPNKRPSAAPKIFKEGEVVLFLIHLMPSKSRVSKTKIILSSADIISFFNITDYFVEGLGKMNLDLNTIAWVSSLDPKTIFNTFCNYICNKIILRRWQVYRRPFIYYSKDISKKIYYHQNDYLLLQQKTTPKIRPFLRVFGFDFEFEYHKVKRWKEFYLIISIIKKPKDKTFNIKTYVQKNCRVYSTQISADHLSSIIEDYIADLMIYLIKTPATEFANSFSGLLKIFKRRKPSQIVVENKGLESVEEDSNIFEILGRQLGNIIPDQSQDASSSSDSDPLLITPEMQIGEARNRITAVRTSRHSSNLGLAAFQYMVKNIKSSLNSILEISIDQLTERSPEQLLNLLSDQSPKCFEFFNEWYLKQKIYYIIDKPQDFQKTKKKTLLIVKKKTMILTKEKGRDAAIRNALNSITEYCKNMEIIFNSIVVMVY